MGVTFACDSALRWASMEGCRERPSMLFAWGSEESEQARLGSAMRDSGGVDLVEEADELDFWEGMVVRVTLEGPRRSDGVEAG